MKLIIKFKITTYNFIPNKMPTCTVSMNILTKIITVCVCLLIIAAAFFNIITLGGFSLSSIILSVYFMIFAIALIFAQCKLRLFLKYFRLLAFPLGKAIYCIIIGLLMIQTTTFGLTMACAFILLGLGLYYVFTHYVYAKCRKDQTYHVMNNLGSANST